MNCLPQIPANAIFADDGLLLPSLIALGILAVLGFGAGLVIGLIRWGRDRARIQQLLDENTAMCRETEQIRAKGLSALRPAGES